MANPEAGEPQGRQSGETLRGDPETSAGEESTINSFAQLRETWV